MHSTPPNLRSQFVVCLAGHIDHGKSALVHALTGGRVDRLPEEKRRGITIELGFSHLDEGDSRFAFVDVPGHERFVHTMVAGASGVNAALLVIAADDSVMPQTREHLAVLELLGVRRGVVAITKCDLADEEQLDLVELEVAELVAPTFLADAPRIRVSVQTGAGIDEVRRAIVATARSAPERPKDDARFRLPVDRAFSATGQGAVVTGTVWRGSARVGDTLELLPDKTIVRVRRLQSQGADVEQVSAGERAAINIAGVKVSAIERGNELTTQNAFEPANRHLVQLRIVADAARGVKHRQEVRVHLGANQATAQVLMGQRAVARGEQVFVILKCETPIVAEYGQPFVLRQLSPARTIGGGTIIGPALRASDRQKRCLEAALGLASSDAYERIEAYVGLRREVQFSNACESWIGLNLAQSETIARELVDRGKLVRVGDPPVIYITAQRFQELKSWVVRRCQAELERRKPATFVPLSVIVAALKRHASDGAIEAVLSDMQAQSEIVRRDDRIGLPTGSALSNRQRIMLTTLVAEVTSAGPTPPTLKEFAERHGVAAKDLEAVVQVAIDEGQLIRLTPQLTMDLVALESLRQRLVKHFETSPTAKVGEMREQWGITRKHAVPIFEFFDHHQITSRAGDLRSAGPRLVVPVGEAIT